MRLRWDCLLQVWSDWNSSWSLLGLSLDDVMSFHTCRAQILTLRPPSSVTDEPDYVNENGVCTWRGGERPAHLFFVLMCVMCRCVNKILWRAWLWWKLKLQPAGQTVNAEYIKTLKRRNIQRFQWETRASPADSSSSSWDEDCLTAAEPQIRSRWM